MPTKTCNKCGETKPLHEFHSDSSKADGRKNFCRKCMSQVVTARNKAKRAEAGAGHKQCAKCHKVKPLAEFNCNSKTKDGYRGYCRVCENPPVPLVRPWDHTAMLLLRLFLRDVERGRLRGLAEVAKEMHRPLAEVEDWAAKLRGKGAGRCG